MEFITLFFVMLSIVALGYIGVLFYNTKTRIPVIIEVLFLGVYGLVLMVFLFPQILDFIEDTLGLNSAVDFLVYLSIFVLFFLVLILYKKTEEQRTQITKLVREISYLKKK